MTDAASLKLIAEDPTDLTVIAACLQDALVPISDIAWLQEERQLALAVNRFMWERPAEGDAAAPIYYRTHALVRVDGATAIRSRGYDRNDRARILSLLSLRPVEGGVDLLFSDNAVIRVVAAEPVVTLLDVGDPWPTRWRPGHGED